MIIFQALRVLLLCFLFCVGMNSEIENKNFAASVADLEVSLKQERMLIKNMQKYTVELKSQLKAVKDFLKTMKTKHYETSVDTGDGPFQIWQKRAVIERLQVDWNQNLNRLNGKIGKDLLVELNYTLRGSPSFDDVREAAQGLQRIQFVYDLPIDDMAKGRLIKSSDSTKLSALDLNAIGVMLYRSGCRKNAVYWLESSLRAKFDEKLYRQVFRKSVKRFYYDYKTIALKTNKNFKNLTDIQAVSRGNYQRFNVKSPRNPMIKGFNLGLAALDSVKPVLKAYKRTCRGRRRPINSINKLFCFYKSYVPFLKIAPTKVEVLNFKPLIMLLVDIVTNKDMVGLKKISKYRMKRAGVQLSNITTDVRVAKAFAVDAVMNSKNFDEARWRKNLQFRLGFYFPGVEPPQVINYGIGGHYGLHSDMIVEPVDHSQEVDTGNRYISMVFYLSDVELGGATVFPMLDLGVFPRKGAALLWFNQHDNEFEDYRVWHASCPVIKGSKWILTLWIHKIEIPHIDSTHFISKDLQIFSKYENLKTVHRIIRKIKP